MKKTEKFFEAFTELDDDLIENALPKDQDYDIVKPAMKIHSWKPWVAGVAVAAAAVGVVFAGMKLFGSNGKPGFAPALGDSNSEMRGGMYESGTFESGAFDGPSYGHMLVDWVIYDSAEELVNASDIICTGKVNDISFELIDKKTGKELSDSDDPKNGELCTIYDIMVTKSYRSNVLMKGRLWFRVQGGIEGYKTDEQLALMERTGDNAILVMDNAPKIELGQEYLFLLAKFDGSLPCIINNTQTAFPLSDPSYRDSFSGASVNDILNCLNAGESDHYTEVSITHNTQIISLSDIDINELTAAIQDAMVSDCKPELQLQQMISEQDIENYGNTGYVIDLVFNDVDAPLAGGGDNKKAKTICHATVLIGENNKASYITYSYTSIGLDGSTDQQSGGTYFLGEKSRESLLAVIDASEQAHNDGVYAHECLFDYFYLDNMEWDKTKEFTLPEYPNVKFRWSSDKITAVKNGNETELFSGMPVWGVYLADLNGDGKREICSTVSMGSGIVDNRIYAYDYANGKLYELQDRPTSDYYLKLQDGVLMYVQQVQNASSMVRNPLTVGAMTCHSTGGVHHEEETSHHDEPDTTSHHEEESSHHEEDHNAVPITPANSGTHHSEHNETHH